MICDGVGLKSYMRPHSIDAMIELTPHHTNMHNALTAVLGETTSQELGENKP